MSSCHHTRSQVRARFRRNPSLVKLEPHKVSLQAPVPHVNYTHSCCSPYSVVSFLYCHIHQSHLIRLGGNSRPRLVAKNHLSSHKWKSAIWSLDSHLDGLRLVSILRAGQGCSNYVSRLDAQHRTCWSVSEPLWYTSRTAKHRFRYYTRFPWQ